MHIRRYVLNELLTMDAPFMGPSWVPSYTLSGAHGHLVASWSLVPSQRPLYALEGVHKVPTVVRTYILWSGGLQGGP